MELENLWHNCLEIIKDNVSEKAYTTWFLPIVPVKYEGNEFVLQVPSHFFYEYIEEQYAHLIHASLTRVAGTNLTIYYRILVDNSDSKKKHTTIQSDKTVNSGNDSRKYQNDPIKTPDPLTMPLEWNSNLKERLSFSNFLEGPSNVLARRIGEAIAAKPGKTFNPMYIYGNIGVGKTHLCHAIGNKIRELHPDKKIIYISSLLFQVQFTEATKNNTFNDFVNFYQNVDTLIIDDIQDFAGKEKTQNAYFHIFNHLHILGKQLILTSDKPPVELQGLEERMITRLKWGVTAELQKPDIALRKKILQHIIKQNGLVVSEEIINFIAESAADQVRDLEGIITSLLAQSLVFNKEIDMDMVRMTVKNVVKIGSKIITAEKIQNTVCSYFNIPLKDIHSKSRKQEIVKARHICMFLFKKHTNYSFAHIGSLIGKRDHATVLHGVKAIQNLLDVNKSFRSEMSELDVLLLK